MKRKIKFLVMVFVLQSTLSQVSAQDPIALIIKQGIVEVIKAVDLKVQRLQTKTIWLQNAQKVLENAMSKLKLDEIRDWTERQRLLYRNYFEELQEVKAVLLNYQDIKEITQLQLALVKEYKKSFDAIRQDRHFTPEEVIYMSKVYSGILQESLVNLDGLYLVANSFTTQMSDEKRMEIIRSVKGALQKNYDDVRRYSAQNVRLSLARARDENEIFSIRKLYGIQ